MTFEEKRQAMTVRQQLANIGSEVSRCIKAKKKHQTDRMYDAYQRMLDLYLLTQLSPNIPDYRKKEIIRSKEVAMDYLLGDNIYKSTEKKIMNYYDFFI